MGTASESSPADAAGNRVVAGDAGGDAAVGRAGAVRKPRFELDAAGDAAARRRPETFREAARRSALGDAAVGAVLEARVARREGALFAERHDTPDAVEAVTKTVLDVAPTSRRASPRQRKKKPKRYAWRGAAADGPPVLLRAGDQRTSWTVLSESSDEDAPPPLRWKVFQRRNGR